MTLGKTLLNEDPICPICSELDNKAAHNISAIAQEKTYHKGELLMQEGDLCEGFFLILSGKVRVYKSSAQGKEKVLLIAKKGMTFGEDALFGDGRFQNMAEALSTTSVLHIPKKGFLGLLKSDHALSLQVMESLCMWIKRLSMTVEDGIFFSARDKTARYLLDLYYQNDCSMILNLPDKKKEIAEQLGLAPETLSRTMHELVEENVLIINKRTITVLDIEQLENIGQVAQ